MRFARARIAINAGSRQARQMWCPDCQQEVPALTVDVSRPARCARCGARLVSESEQAIRDALELARDESPHSAPKPDYADDATTAEVDRVEHEVSAREALCSPTADDAERVDTSAEDSEHWEFDEDPIDELPPWSRPRREARPSSARSGEVTDWRPAAAIDSHTTRADMAGAQSPNNRKSFGQTLRSGCAWLALASGTMAFACGVVLLAWSVYGARPGLWNLGIPFTLGGQVALLIGLCLQLDRLWSENRETGERLAQLDNRLSELRRSTQLLGSPYHGPAQNFYSHLSQGAGTELLLSDLKAQLDLLALEMARQRDAA